MSKSAVQFLKQKLKSLFENDDSGHYAKLFAEAEEIEKQLLGDCWDSAIEAHDKRGYNHSRSWCDFDEYFNKLSESEIKKPRKQIIIDAFNAGNNDNHYDTTGNAAENYWRENYGN